MNRFIPYGRQCIENDDIEAVISVLKNDFITTGPKVAEFEESICEKCGSKFASVVSSGTAALHLASLALLKPKDRVLVTPNTFLSTVNAILYANATPVFVDIDKEGNIDLDRCYEMLGEDPSIKALYGVHFSGNMINQQKLKKIKDEFDITILEDCAHSLGAFEKNTKAGSCENSDVSILSFHPVKHITTGEGGAVTTNRKDIYDKIISLRNNGTVRDSFENIKLAFDKNGNKNPWYYEMQQLGFNYRITDIQCALGLSQMKKLDRFLKHRHRIAKRYDEAFKDNRIIQPLYYHKEGAAYHLYVVKIDFSQLKITRAELFSSMRQRGIGLQVHYIPVYKQPYYRKMGFKVSLPNCEQYYKSCVSLPIYYMLTEREQDFVIDNLMNLIKKNEVSK